MIKKTNNKAKRIWFITDTHLGVKNNSNEWIEIMREYFFEWFIPLVKKNYQPGDILIHLGDVYDSRQSINIKVLNLGIELFEELSSLFVDGIYVIAGNHDLWGKLSNEINSLKSIKWIPNVNILEEPESIIFGDKKFMMMPWRRDHNAEIESLDSSEPHDVLCCHADIRGLKFNKFVNVDSGADISKFNKFNRVYSGHIHYSQKSGNIRMLGSPYEITRSDMDNTKSITLLDLGDMEEEIFVNDFSPKYKKIYFTELLEKTPDELDPLFRNNFVDIMIDPDLSLRSPLSIITDIMVSQRSIKFHPYDSNKSTLLSSRMLESEGDGNFNVMDFISIYVKGLDCDDDEKNRIISGLNKLYNIVITKEEDKKL
jgi:DNA repair exonuclease SbcCD nuclease subunit